MHLFEKWFTISQELSKTSINDLRYLVDKELQPGEIPLRFVITRSDASSFDCEIGILANSDLAGEIDRESLFTFNKRGPSGSKDFNAVLLVPTGIGAEIGGHDGDAGPIAILLASVCDNLITHPNVVNGADINELPGNGLYTEGSIICRLLLGQIALQKVRSNRLLMVIGSNENPLFVNAAVNSVNAARATYGLECPFVLHLDPGFSMKSVYSSSGRAVGLVENISCLADSLSKYREDFDAIAIASHVQVPEDLRVGYYKGNIDCVNPWGGVEAMLTHFISTYYNVSSAHSPMYEDVKFALRDYGIVDPRMAAEVISLTFLQCVLKGLKTSPKIVVDTGLFGTRDLISASEISCLIIPDGCVGLPTLAALEQGIPVIAVRENKNLMRNDLGSLPWKPGQLHIVENYWEAAGVMTALKSGLNPESIRRPIKHVEVIREKTADSLNNKYNIAK